MEKFGPRRDEVTGNGGDYITRSHFVASVIFMNVVHHRGP